MVLALGWAADESMVTTALTGDCDVMCVYDYRNIEPLTPPDSECYKSIELTAWSYGVWAAEQIFPHWNFQQAIAINGTPKPVDELYGISRRMFDMTVNGLEKAGLQKFTLRMCNNTTERVQISRDTDECIEELRTLGDHFKMGYNPTLKWSRAVVGGHDLIFPPQTQMRYWSETAVEIDYREEMPHFPFGIL